MHAQPALRMWVCILNFMFGTIFSPVLIQNQSWINHFLTMSKFQDEDVTLKCLNESNKDMATVLV